MSCKKRKYKDKISAMFALSQCRKQDAVGNRQELRVYFCPVCKHWHLTSKIMKNKIHRSRTCNYKEIIWKKK